MHRSAAPLLTILLPLLLLTGCASQRASMEVIAQSPDRQWTGVAVLPNGRAWVNYPRWAGPYNNAVEEITGGGRRPYPDASWNLWEPGDDPSRAWVCVQSVHVDSASRLWVLDPANPRFEGVVEGGPKLVLFDPRSDRLGRVYRFGPTIAPPESYLNDVRVDVRAHRAYITDSGGGAIIVLDLASGRARRLLDDHFSTEAEDIEITVGNKPLLGPDGKTLRVRADGIALDADNGWLYWQALTGRTLYRAPTRVLGDWTSGPVAITASVEIVADTVVTDGMAMDQAKNIYFSALERDAVMYRTPSGELRTLIQDPRLSWPDSFAIRPGSDGRPGRLYVTTARIHESELLGVEPDQRTGPYEVLSLPLAPAPE